jgi:hypothetical protein
LEKTALVREFIKSKFKIATQNKNNLHTTYEIQYHQSTDDNANLTSWACHLGAAVRACLTKTVHGHANGIF